MTDNIDLLNAMAGAFHTAGKLCAKRASESFSAMDQMGFQQNMANRALMSDLAVAFSQEAARMSVPVEPPSVPQSVVGSATEQRFMHRQPDGPISVDMPMSRAPDDAQFGEEAERSAAVPISKTPRVHKFKGEPPAVEPTKPRGKK